MDNDHLESIYSQAYPQIEELLKGWDEPVFRTRQIWEGLYKHLWDNPLNFTNLPKPLLEKLAARFSFSSLLPENRLESSDQATVKTLFQLHDRTHIETILMHYRERISLCISTQVGCSLNCSFCATGQMGYSRDLSSAEIIEQVLWHARMLKAQEKQLTNIVLMGMGEPFLNYENVMEAIFRLNDARGFSFGERRFTISTAGIVPAIQRFTSEKHQINLAISLHAANDRLRSALMPINRKYPLNALMQACREYVQRTNRRLTFEWALIDGVNDSDQDAQELIQLLKGMLCHVNLIPLNPTDEYQKHAATEKRARDFSSRIQSAGIPCSIRLRRGIDIQAGCGQLAIRKKSDA